MPTNLPGGGVKDPAVDQNFRDLASKLAENEIRGAKLRATGEILEASFDGGKTWKTVKTE